LAEAHVLALALCHPSSHTIINLGTGTGYSVMQVIATAETVTKLKVPRKVGARRPGDPAILVASNDKAKKLLGWKPQRDLETIIQDAWNFMTRVKA
jgi:UDP-glucose 4-epimerase